jgi:tetratricopeptide (TPR) repeat protein
MKGKTFKPYILSALMFLFVVPAVSQDRNGSKYNTSEDSINCGKHLSAYRTFFKLRLYEDAYEKWWNAFNDCPASSEMMYLDGVTMYRAFIEAAPHGPVREGLIDTLMLIYDRRMEYFGGEGNVLGRKGGDLLTYRRADIEQVQKAYEMLKTSIELEGEESREVVMLLFISAGITLNKQDIIDDNQVIDNYSMVIGTLCQLEERSSRWKRTRATIDEIMQKDKILSCETLNRYYEPQFEQNKDNKTFLEIVIALYTAAGCDRSHINVAASENLYRIEPGPEISHNLAILFIARNDFEKAAGYLKEAVQGENINEETRATWYYELAVVSSASKEHCKAIEYAHEAIKLKSDYGKAYILLGDSFIASRDNLGDDFQQRAAYWAAADMYKKATSVDPSVAEETNQKLTDYAGQYPNNEDIFFRDIEDGDPYLVGGCINEYTTVRSSR